MSTTVRAIPDRARTIELRKGRIDAPGEPNHGLPASFEVREANVSGTRTLWIIVRVGSPDAPQRFGWADRPYWCKRATGRNIAALERQLPELREMIAVES